MMLVVADTSPMNYLILIGQIDVLFTLFSRVLIPQAVMEELHHPQTPPAVRAWSSSPPGWLDIRQIDAAPDANLLTLDAGEQAAILLAEALHADLLLADDRDARRVAEQRALTVLGTLGVLAQASDQGLIDLPNALAQLQTTNFRMTFEMAQRLLARDAQRKGKN